MNNATQSKSHGQAQIQRIEKQSLPVFRGPANSHCKGMRIQKWEECMDIVFTIGHTLESFKLGTDMIRFAIWKDHPMIF